MHAECGKNSGPFAKRLPFQITASNQALLKTFNSAVSSELLGGNKLQHLHYYIKSLLLLVCAAFIAQT